MSTPSDPIAAVSHGDPYPYYAALRADAALHWIASLKLWAIVRADAIHAAFNLPLARVRPATEPVPAFLAGTPGAKVFGALARMNDGVVHGQQRSRTMTLMQRLDGPTMAAGAAAVIGRLAEAWDSRRDGASLDALLTDLPVLSVLAALGFPAEVRHELLSAVAGWVRGLSPFATACDQQEAIASIAHLRTVLAALGVTDDSDVATHVAVLMQPHEATAGLIGAGVLRLMRDPELRDAAAASRLDWGRFTTEVLRHDPPIQNTRRTLASDAVIGRQHLMAGDTLLLVLASGSHDLPGHAEPESFRMDRALPPGLALGAGVHRCPGGDAAAAIATVAWQHVAPGLTSEVSARLLDPVGWRRSSNARIARFTGPSP